MKFVRLAWLIFCPWCCLSLPAASPAASSTAPFIQRITLVDFHLLETNNDLALSPSNQLVICLPNFQRAGAVDRAVALRRAANGKWWLTYLVAVPPGKPGDFRREESELDPVIAHNVLIVFRHLLESNVYPPTDALHQPSADDGAWVFLRDGQAVVSGVTSNRSLQRSQGEEVGVYRDLCAGLVGVFVVPAGERSDILSQLDRFSARYIALKKLARP